MERRSLDAVDPQRGNAAMRRVRHPTLRNKIKLADPVQVHAWTRRLDVSMDALKAVVDKVGNSAAAVTKEVHSQRARYEVSAASTQTTPAEGELPPAA
jgi:hypothetical protein